VMKSIIAGTLTDVFGDVPYREAARGRSGEVDPGYDRQEDIYLGEVGILDNLKQADELLANPQYETVLNGDPLFQGNLGGWRKLANSLRLRYLSRAALAAGPTVDPEIIELLTSGAPLIQDEADDASFAFTSAPNDFRFARARLGDFTNYLMSETIDSTLDALADPREQLWFREASNGGFNGIRNGIPSDFAYDGSNISLPGEIWRENAASLQFAYMTAWETNFHIAIAAQRGLSIPFNDESRYELAVEQAFSYWNVELPSDYLERPGVAYTGRAEIATQLWLARIGQGYEGWIGWRLYGQPAYLPPLSSLNGGLIPIRFPYPADEQALNSENYEAVIQRLGGENSPNVPVWWDE